MRSLLNISIFLLCSNVGHSTLPTDTTKVKMHNSKEFKTLLPYKQQSTTVRGTINANQNVVSFKNQYLKKEGQSLDRMKKWGKSYFSLYDKILTEYGVPVEMKYLSVIESSLNPLCRSWAGAVGPWQLMYDEAMRFGLVVNNQIDERTDYKKSTVAAAKLLRELHQQFGDWLLVLAAYNAGPGAVRRAIRKSGSNDFWKLQYDLPTETRNHVKRFISTHYFFEGNGSIATMTKSEAEHYQWIKARQKTLTADERKRLDEMEIKGFYNDEVVARSLNIPITQFQKMNPDMNRSLSNGNPYTLQLPKDKMEIFRTEQKNILEKCFNELLN